MRSEILALSLAGLIAMQGCGNSTSLSSDSPTIGRKPEFFSTSYLFRAGDKNSLTAVDRTGMTLQRFTLDPFAHEQSLSLALDEEKQGVLAAANGQYFVTLGETDYAIIKADGTSVVNPIGLAGKIASAAFDPVHHYLLIADEFKSMAIMTLSPSGDDLGHVAKGNLFPGEKLIVAGTMLDDGRLVLAVGEKTIAIIDVGMTVAKQEWEYTSFDVTNAKAMTWLASVPDQPSIVMIRDQDRLLSIDVDAKAILDAKDITNLSVIGQFRDYSPHVIYNTPDELAAQKANITYVGEGGKFVHKPISDNGKQLLQTWLDPVTSFLTVAFNPGAQRSDPEVDSYYLEAQEIYRVRLTDNLVERTAPIAEKSHMAITPNYIFLLYPSALGKASRLNYGSKENANEQKLEGYNLELFADDYRSSGGDDEDDD